MPFRTPQHALSWSLLFLWLWTRSMRAISRGYEGRINIALAAYCEKGTRLNYGYSGLSGVYTPPSLPPPRLWWVVATLAPQVNSGHCRAWGKLKLCVIVRDGTWDVYKDLSWTTLLWKGGRCPRGPEYYQIKRKIRFRLLFFSLRLQITIHDIHMLVFLLTRLDMLILIIHDSQCYFKINARYLVKF